MQIVIAWAVREQEWDGRPFRADLGIRPGMRDVIVPKAVMWLNDGTDADLVSALAYCERENQSIVDGEMAKRCYVSDRISDPLERARVLYLQDIPQ